jgi:hypothetical protein
MVVDIEERNHQSLVASMERMFDEHLPISNSGVRHQRVKNLHDGHLTIEDSMGKVLGGIVLALMI